MPSGDGTGPFGTFRNCMPVNAQGNSSQMPFYGRRFFGRRFGGRGFRGRFSETGVPGWQWFQQDQQTPATQQTKENEIKFLEQELESIKKRIEEIKKEA